MNPTNEQGHSFMKVIDPRQPAFSGTAGGPLLLQALDEDPGAQSGGGMLPTPHRLGRGGGGG